MTVASGAVTIHTESAIMFPYTGAVQTARRLMYGYEGEPLDLKSENSTSVAKRYHLEIANGRAECTSLLCLYRISGCP